MTNVRATSSFDYTKKIHPKDKIEIGACVQINSNPYKRPIDFVYATNFSKNIDITPKRHTLQEENDLSLY